MKIYVIYSVKLNGRHLYQKCLQKIVNG
uniref:Uncharacterized protein n=1 Tax=Anguilla anguilla TaxID=7936 RepID=A0A0E9PPG1_ANGAN